MYVSFCKDYISLVNKIKFSLYELSVGSSVRPIHQPMFRHLHPQSYISINLDTFISSTVILNPCLSLFPDTPCLRILPGDHIYGTY